MRLIDADALEKEMQRRAALGPDSKIPTWSKAICCVKDAQTATDTVKRGKWIDSIISVSGAYNIYCVECTECKAKRQEITEFCPCCGAMMEDESNATD